ncbi:hypothetical protein [Aquirufa lenticrescens]|jgi:hypothetical protein|uniref:hypothetical protein n=1 Tax=Aquirufa lenticrescens TaxID=2696560 RepID=UPI001CAA75C5|nr:hypothetical protein [Aquirufa lenticrescens]UAJ13014.1 hypothetical protein G9X62_00045 [Aquirufa lenticrescens]
MEFSEYLIQKNICSASFSAAEPALFQNWSEAFNLLHPASFTEQNKFIINKIRRKYPLKKE